MAYRNNTYVAFDATNDIRYYRLMTAWKQNDYSSFHFFDAHDLTNIMSWSTEESIKRSLRERLLGTKIFVLLVGERTKYHHKFITWEIEQAIKLELPIVVVNLNGTKWMDPERCPFILKDKLAIHVSFNAKIMQYALENWKFSDNVFKQRKETGPRYYQESVYKELGL